MILQWGVEGLSFRVEIAICWNMCCDDITVGLKKKFKYFHTNMSLKINRSSDRWKELESSHIAVIRLILLWQEKGYSVGFVMLLLYVWGVQWRFTAKLVDLLEIGRKGRNIEIYIFLNI